MVSGIVTARNVAKVTWEDTSGAPHTAFYTAVTGDTLATVTSRLNNAINAVVGGNIIATNVGASAIMLTQRVAGTVGNGRKLTTGTAAIVTTLDRKSVV